MGLDPARGIDEIDRVVGVLLDAGGDREDVGVEDDVLGRKAHLVDQHAIGALADLRLARQRVGLALLVERHHHRGRAVAADQRGLALEFVGAFLQRDRVDDALALDALQAGLDHAPLRRVDHDRHAGDLRLAGDQVQEAHHRGLAVEHGLVHVDVDDLRAVLDLLPRDAQRVFVAALEHHARERLGAGDVGALADVDEQRFFIQRQRLQPGQLQGRDRGIGWGVGHRGGLMDLALGTGRLTARRLTGRGERRCTRPDGARGPSLAASPRRRRNAPRTMAAILQIWATLSPPLTAWTLACGPTVAREVRTMFSFCDSRPRRPHAVGRLRGRAQATCRPDVDRDAGGAAATARTATAQRAGRRSQLDEAVVRRHAGGRRRRRRRRDARRRAVELLLRRQVHGAQATAARGDGQGRAIAGPPGQRQGAGGDTGPAWHAAPRCAAT